MALFINKDPHISGIMLVHPILHYTIYSAMFTNKGPTLPREYASGSYTTLYYIQWHCLLIKDPHISGSMLVHPRVHYTIYSVMFTNKGPRHMWEYASPPYTTLYYIQWHCLLIKDPHISGSMLVIGCTSKLPDMCGSFINKQCHCI